MVPFPRLDLGFYICKYTSPGYLTLKGKNKENENEGGLIYQINMTNLNLKLLEERPA